MQHACMQRWRRHSIARCRCPAPPRPPALSPRCRPLACHAAAPCSCVGAAAGPGCVPQCPLPPLAVGARSPIWWAVVGAPPSSNNQGQTAVRSWGAVGAQPHSWQSRCPLPAAARPAPRFPPARPAAPAPPPCVRPQAGRGPGVRLELYYCQLRGAQQGGATAAPAESQGQRPIPV